VVGPTTFPPGKKTVTNPALDPIAKIPELKVCVVLLEKAKRG
jgi:hypothetical protein